MDDVQEAVQLEANLTALPDNPSNEQILQAVKGFRNASVPIAMYRLLEAASGGGGGGASWIGPVKANAFMGQNIGASSNSADGGTYTLTLAGETTSAIPWDASLAALAAALEALPSIGDVTVTSFGAPPTINDSYTINFGPMGATEVVTGDLSELTGPDAPYTIEVSAASDLPAPLVTLAVGDVLEDVFIAIPEAFDSGVAIYFTDNTDGNDTPPAWGAFQSPPATILLDEASSLTNFVACEVDGPSSLVTRITDFWIGDGGVSVYRLPVIATDAVTIYASLSNLPDPPTQGEVWLYVSVAQVVAP